jgi:hypothetical protein
LGQLEHYLFVEQLRATVLDAVFRCGQTRLCVAEEAGVTPRTVTALLRGDYVSPYALRKLDVWCEIWGYVGAWAEQAALALLVDGLPVEKRLKARQVYTRWYRARAARAGIEEPAWVADEAAATRYLLTGRRR